MGFDRCVYIIHTRTIFYTFTYYTIIYNALPPTNSDSYFYLSRFNILYRILNEL